MSGGMGNKATVLLAMTELFGDRDASAVDRWIAPDYIQHNFRAADGAESLRGFIAGLSAETHYDVVRVLVDGDLVALHGVYHGFRPGVSLVAFDIFRVHEGKLAEHWDVLTPVVEHTVSGRSQVDGPTEVTHPELSERSRQIAAGFVETVLIGGHTEAITDYISTEQYYQHNPLAGDGPDGFAALLAQWAEKGIVMTYDTLHRVVADGEFVLTQSEGSLAGKPTAFYDLFRIPDDKIVEHWDVINEIPVSFVHHNGPF
ncbi:nuclear transport factor 2 family protein [Nocardia sp. XZ_19_385]|uniref:nuclear transport factor 2 family protein n=1 Tax=Nocardia sp. XZ_19_385 TaxID=2769488 RepID=UPI002815133D|nr:nuclear transport factor 2 family protein [Nocardia sp. XZ_19_385]